jgi:hypothetical protein
MTSRIAHTFAPLYATRIDEQYLNHQRERSADSQGHQILEGMITTSL